MSPALKRLHDSVHTQLLYVLARFTSEHAPLLVWLSHVCVCIECRVASQRCQSLEGGRSAWDWTNRLNLKDFNSVVAAGWICYGMATQVCVCVCVYLHTVNVNDILVLVRMVSGQRCYDVLWAVEKFRLCLHDFMSLWILLLFHIAEKNPKQNKNKQKQKKIETNKFSYIVFFSTGAALHSAEYNTTPPKQTEWWYCCQTATAAGSSQDSTGLTLSRAQRGGGGGGGLVPTSSL